MDMPGGRDIIFYALAAFFGWYFIRMVKSIEKLNINMAIVFEELNIKHRLKKGMR